MYPYYFCTSYMLSPRKCLSLYFTEIIYNKAEIEYPRQYLKPEYELNVQKGSFRLLCMYLLKCYKGQLEFSMYGSSVPQEKN